MRNKLINRILFSLLLGSACVAGQYLKAMETEETPSSRIRLKLETDLTCRLQPQQIGLSYDGEKILVRIGAYSVRIMEKTEATGQLFDRLMFAMKDSELKKFYWEGQGYEEDFKYDLAAEAHNKMFAHISSEERIALLAWYTAPTSRPVVQSKEEPVDDRPTSAQVQAVVELYPLYPVERGEDGKVKDNKEWYCLHREEVLRSIPLDKKIIHTCGGVRWQFENMQNLTAFCALPIRNIRFNSSRSSDSRIWYDISYAQAFWPEESFMPNANGQASGNAIFIKLPIEDSV